jgi:DNA-directed RNA polymerase subunit RPC12/RpoP
MSNPVSCTDCGEKLTFDDAALEPDQRTPCPKCGSKARTVQMRGSVSGSSSFSATATVVTYPEILMQTATNLIVESQYSIATVVIHMACEIATERALSEAFATNGVASLEEAVEALLPGYNLSNERIRDLYNALTGRKVQDEPFWQAFKESATRRNRIVHKAKLATDAEAKASYSAAEALLNYLK